MKTCRKQKRNRICDWTNKNLSGWLLGDHMIRGHWIEFLENQEQTNLKTNN